MGGSIRIGNPVNAQGSIRVAWRAYTHWMPKKTPKPPKRRWKISLIRWQISLIKGTPQKFLGSVDAPDERTALDLAAREFKVPDVLRSRLVARREG